MMTKKTICKLNHILDEVYSLMLNEGYDQHKLNKAFLIFNLTSLNNEVNTFNWIFDTLIKINEDVEQYEICSLIKENRKWIK